MSCGICDIIKLECMLDKYDLDLETNRYKLEHSVSGIMVIDTINLTATWNNEQFAKNIYVTEDVIGTIKNSEKGYGFEIYRANGQFVQVGYRTHLKGTCNKVVNKF